MKTIAEIIVLVMFCFITNNIVYGKQGNRFSQEEIKMIHSEFNIFKDNVIIRTDKAKNFLEMIDVIQKGEFLFINSYKNINLEYNSDRDTIKICNEIDIKKIRETFINGKILLDDEFAYITPNYIDDNDYKKFPQLSLFYSKKEKRWFISNISYLIPDKASQKYDKQNKDKASSTITADNVNVRTLSNKTSQILAQLYKDKKVIVIEKSNEPEEIAGEKHHWYKIEFQKDGKTIRGWVYGKFIKVLEGK